MNLKQWKIEDTTDLMNARGVVHEVPTPIRIKLRGFQIIEVVKTP